MASDQFGNKAKNHLETYQNAKILYCAVLENMFPVSSARQIDFLQIIGLLEITEIGRYRMLHGPTFSPVEGLGK